MTSVLDIYSLSFTCGKFLWVIPPDMKFPSNKVQSDTAGTNRLLKCFLAAIHRFFGALIFAYLTLQYLFLLFRGAVSLNRLRLGEVNGFLEAFSWILASMLPLMTVLVFQTQKPKLEKVLMGLHELDRALIQRRISYLFEKANLVAICGCLCHNW